jgi:hypothetical protein
MAPGREPVEFTLMIDAGEGADQAEVDQLTRHLLVELDEADVESADLVSAEAPEGTRTAGAVTVGALAIAVLPVFIDKLVEFLIEWTKRDDRRAVTIKAEVAGESVEVSFNPQATTSEEIKKLVESLRPGKEAE